MRKHNILALILLASFAVIAASKTVYARSETVFVSGNITTCADLFTALHTYHGYQFGAYAKNGPVAIRSEIRITSVYDGVIATDGVQKVKVYNFDGASYDWAELDMVTGLAAGNRLGYDAVARKAGNGRTVTVYIPEATDDVDQRDHNNNNNITEILFCADAEGQAYDVGSLCPSLNSNALADVCNVLGNNALFEVTRPISGTELSTELCACPDVITTREACDPAPTCTGGDCCNISPNGNILAMAGPPTSVSKQIGLGSLCQTSGQTKTTSTGETVFVKNCFCDPNLESKNAIGQCICNPGTIRAGEVAPDYPISCDTPK